MQMINERGKTLKTNGYDFGDGSLIVQKLSQMKNLIDTCILEFLIC